GDSLFGSTVQSVSLSAQGLNNKGQVTFWAGLADGRDVIARADPAYTPAQIRAAYRLPPLNNLPASWRGSGQTIAIVDAGNDPYLFDDAQAFNARFGLPLFGSNGGPNFAVYNQAGVLLSVNSMPTANTPGLTGNDPGFYGEDALDVEGRDPKMRSR